MITPASPLENSFIKATYRGIISDQQNSVLLSAAIFKRFQLKPGLTARLKMGTLLCDVVVNLVHSSGHPGEAVFFLSPLIAAECHMPVGTLLTLRYNLPENTLYAGPLIGLFTVRNILVDAGFGSQEPSLTALVHSAVQLSGLVFVFCPEDIIWDRSSVTGYIPAQSGAELSAEGTPGQAPEEPVTGSPEATESLSTGLAAWQPLTLPLPDIIYDRIPSRSIESRPEVQAAKARLQSLDGIPYFNPMFLNKWETHMALLQVPEVLPYLPPTRLVEGPEDVREFLSLYDSVFLKPSTGSLGRRIIKISAHARGEYRYMYRSKEKSTIQGSAADFAALWRQLKPLMGRRVYIVQKDLRLAKFEDCPFDIRILAQKDMWGEWRRTKIYVRKAAPDSFLSNISDGARPKSISTVLKEVFNVDFTVRDGLAEEIRKATRLIPPALETGTGQIWGELGIDLGLDCNGRTWLIEINSKPFRALVSESGSFKTIERSLMRPLEFAKFRAGFYRHSPVGCDSDTL